MEAVIKLNECTVFFSFLRLVIGLTQPAAGFTVLSARLLDANTSLPAPNQRSNGDKLEALITRANFPDKYILEVLTSAGLQLVSCRSLVDNERLEFARSSLVDLQSIFSQWRDVNHGRSPQVLDIGGRARSGFLLAHHLPGCDVTVLDIRADEGVDVVADIHSMSDVFEEQQFDFVICVSVFEHLAMPWKAALEINKVLRHGGIALIQTHQTVGMHDLPWDYFRFSDESWKGIFNVATGFEIISTRMNDFVRIVPAHHHGASEDYENAGGFYDSSVLCRKIGATQVTWPVALASIVSTTYPD